MGDRRFAVLGRTTNGSGERMLILPDDSVVFVPPDSTDEDLATRFAVDSIVHAPEVTVWPGVYVDGPLAGSAAYVTVNDSGARTEFRLSRAEGGRRGSYEVVQIAEGGQPAELRFVGFANDGSPGSEGDVGAGRDERGGTDRGLG